MRENLFHVIPEGMIDEHLGEQVWVSKFQLIQNLGVPLG
jgi:hypothetical protein